MKFIEISFFDFFNLFFLSIVRGGDLNPECFYQKLRCKSIKLQDFWYNSSKYWKKTNNKLHCTSCNNSTNFLKKKKGKKKEKEKEKKKHAPKEY